jgi:protein-S-isoprenylcysteine O-methyltransferase Ste14
MSKNPVSLLLVFVQGLAIISIFMTGPVIVQNPVLIILEAFAFILMIWSVVLMTLKSKIQATPEIATGAKLLEKGPYAYIRHPMYSGGLLFTLTMIINFFSWVRLVFWLILLIDFMLKISLEEQILEKHFHGYKAYQRKTKKLIPGIY